MTSGELFDLQPSCGEEVKDFYKRIQSNKTDYPSSNSLVEWDIENNLNNFLVPDLYLVGMNAKISHDHIFCDKDYNIVLPGSRNPDISCEEMMRISLKKHIQREVRHCFPTYPPICEEMLDSEIAIVVQHIYRTFANALEVKSQDFNLIISLGCNSTLVWSIERKTGDAVVGTACKFSGHEFECRDSYIKYLSKTPWISDIIFNKEELDTSHRQDILKEKIIKETINWKRPDTTGPINLLVIQKSDYAHGQPMLALGCRRIWGYCYINQKGLGYLHESEYTIALEGFKERYEEKDGSGFLLMGHPNPRSRIVPIDFIRWPELDPESLSERLSMDKEARPYFQYLLSIT